MMIKQNKSDGRRIFLPFICLILVGVMALTVFLTSVCAAESKEEDPRVFDHAGLFDPEETAKLEEELLRLRRELKAEFMVVTVDETGGRTAQETADAYYLYFFSHDGKQNFDEDGAIVLLDMANREIYLGTYGIMIRVITDQRLEAILDAAYPYAAQGNYAQAAWTMLQECEAYVQKGIVPGQYNYHAETGKIQIYPITHGYEALAAFLVSGAAFLVSAAAGGLACRSVCRSYRMESGKEKAGSRAYLEDEQFQLDSSADQLLNTTVHHTVIQRQHSSGHGSGGSSSRRSTTHSYHGHSAGGGGRKF